MACRGWRCSKENGGVACGLAWLAGRGQERCQASDAALVAPSRNRASPAAASTSQSRCNFFYTACSFALHLASSLTSVPGIIYARVLGQPPASTSASINTHLGAAPTLDLTTSPPQSTPSLCTLELDFPHVRLPPQALSSKVHRNTALTRCPALRHTQSSIIPH